MQWVAKKKACLQVASTAKFKSPLSPVKEVESDTEKGELYHD